MSNNQYLLQLQFREAETLLSRANQKHRTSRNIKWTPPSPDLIKINVDGSVRGSPGGMAVGGIGRSSTGDWLFGFTSNMGNGFATTAEIHAIKLGLECAWKQGYRNIVVESDSSLAVQFICRDPNPPPELIPLIQECRALFHKDWQVEIQQVTREVNGCADILAKMGHQFSMGIHELNLPLPLVAAAVSRDKIGLG